MDSGTSRAQGIVPQALASLYTFCSAIDLEALRAPTVGQTRRIAAGINVVPEIDDVYPLGNSLTLLGCRL